MEHLGQSKTLLSERIAQQKLAEQVEAERWTRELHDSVRSELIKLVKGELNAAVGAIKKGIEGLPQQITDSTVPLREVLEQAQSETNTLKLVSSVWLKVLLVGVCTSVGIGLGSWGVLSWMGSEVQRLNSEIRSAKATLAQLPNGVSYAKGEDGKGYILAPSMGKPFETKSGKMAVEVN